MSEATPPTRDEAETAWRELEKHRRAECKDWDKVCCTCGAEFPATGQGWKDYYVHPAEAALTEFIKNRTEET